MLRCTLVVVAVVLLMAAAQPAQAHSYLLERAELTAEVELHSTAAAHELDAIESRRAAAEAQATLAAEVARRESDAEIADYAAEHLAELGVLSLADAEAAQHAVFLQMLDSTETDEQVEEDEEVGDEAEAEAEAEDEAEAEGEDAVEIESESADEVEAEADAEEEAADAEEAEADAEAEDEPAKKKKLTERIADAARSAANAVKTTVKKAVQAVSDKVEWVTDTVVGPDVPQLTPGAVPLKTWIVRSDASDKYLKRNRRAYEWADITDGYPWHLKKIPQKEYFSKIALFGPTPFTALIPKTLAALISELGGRRYEGFDKFPRKETIGALPNWHSDRLFGLQRLKGVNPRGFRRCPATWDAFTHAVPNFKATRQGVEHAIHNWLPALSLDDAFAQGLLFYMDYSALDITDPVKFAKVAKRMKDEKQLVPSPIVLYFFARQNTIETFAPIVIQTVQTYDPVQVQGLYYAPPISGDRSYKYWQWRWAKLCVSQADFLYHEIGPHLAHTHLVQEIAIVAAQRELPPLHPAHALVIDHSRKTLALNQGARAKLVPKVFKYLDQPLEMTQPTLTRLWADYNFTEAMTPNDLSLRGIDVSLLKEYDYAKDSLALWSVIRNYTTAVLGQVYESDAAVKADPYLAAFVVECGTKIPGFPKHIESLAVLTDVMTALQFIPTVQHSAVNYLQKFWGGYVPMGPSSLHGRHPKPNEQIGEQFLLDAMPTKVSITLHRQTLKMLSQPTDEPVTTEWGQYARRHAAHLPSLGAGPAWDALIAGINANTAAIRARTRDQASERAYRVLEGQRIANSILI